jgi:hypothetical protein
MEIMVPQIEVKVHDNSWDLRIELPHNAGIKRHAVNCSAFRRI